MPNRLTKDKHLHDKDAEHVYRVHHGLDPQTGEPVRGNTEPAEDECSCAHCVSYVEDDKEILEEAKKAHAEALANGKGERKTSKRKK